MIAALGVLLLLFYGWREIRRYRELNVLGESLFLWKRHLPDPKEPEAKYFRDCLERCQEELEKEQASRETFQQQVGKEQERFTSKLSEEFSAWKNELEDFQRQTERRWRQLRRRFTLGLLLSWALACGALWMLLR